MNFNGKKTIISVSSGIGELDIANCDVKKNALERP